MFLVKHGVVKVYGENGSFSSNRTEWLFIPGLRSHLLRVISSDMGHFPMDSTVHDRCFRYRWRKPGFRHLIRWQEQSVSLDECRQNEDSLVRNYMVKRGYFFTQVTLFCTKYSAFRNPQIRFFHWSFHFSRKILQRQIKLMTKIAETDSYKNSNELSSNLHGPFSVNLFKERGRLQSYNFFRFDI